MYIIIIKQGNGKLKMIMANDINLAMTIDKLGYMGDIIAWTKIKISDINKVIKDSNVYTITELTNWLYN